MKGGKKMLNELERLEEYFFWQEIRNKKKKGATPEKKKT